MVATKNPQTVTIFGRLSYASFTPEEAFALSQKGQYPVDKVENAKPSFNVLVDQAQYDKLLTHIENEFFPFAIEQQAKGEKRNNLTEAETKKLLKDLRNLDDQTFNVGVKEVPEKTKPLAKDCVASVKVTGSKGVAIDKKAIVNSEDELAVPDPDVLSFPLILPVNKTVHDLYAGCIVAVTLNLWAYHNDPKRPGLGIGGSTVVFKADADRFGGGVNVDEDAIFMDE